MTEAEALREIQGFFAANRYEISTHAVLRMRQRGAQESDVRHAIAHATACRKDAARWRVDGPDVDGDELTMICVLESGVVIVTIF